MATVALLLGEAGGPITMLSGWAGAKVVAIDSSGQTGPSSSWGWLGKIGVQKKKKKRIER